MNARRLFLTVLLASGFVLALAPRARASTVLRLELAALLAESRAVVVGTALAATSRWEELGATRRIVTYTRVRVDETLVGKTPKEIVVRTLGGRVGSIGQIVHGEASLLHGKQAVLFLAIGSDGTHFVTGMAQGHFPLTTDASGNTSLQPSPGLDRLVGQRNGPVGAVSELTGRTLAGARRLIRGRLGK